MSTSPHYIAAVLWLYTAIEPALDTKAKFSLWHNNCIKQYMLDFSRKGLILVKHCLILALFLFSHGFSHAENVQSMDVLRLKIEQQALNNLVTAVDGKVNVSVEKIDSRLQLKACADDKLIAFNPHANASAMHSHTMGIKCIDPENHWTIYLPVKISVLKDVYVAKQPLLKGSRIGPDDIVIQEMDVQTLKQGYYTDAEQLLGHIAKQALSQGMAFTPANLQMPRLVKRGEQVKIVAGTDAFTVTMTGIALNDGILGEMVGVKNLSSKKVLEGRVTASQEIRVLD